MELLLTTHRPGSVWMHFSCYWDHYAGVRFAHSSSFHSFVDTSLSKMQSHPVPITPTSGIFGTFKSCIQLLQSDTNRTESVVSPSSESPGEVKEDIALTPDVADQISATSVRSLNLMLFGLCFFSNGFMPSLSTYVSAPYGPEGNLSVK